MRNSLPGSDRPAHRPHAAAAIKAPTAIRGLAAIFALCLLCFAGGAPARAQEPNAEVQAEIEKAKLTEYIRLSQRMKSLFAEKNYEEAREVCRQMIVLMPKAAEPQYNLACAYGRLGRKDEALKALEKAVELGFDDAAHIEKDDDLAPFREEARFRELVAKARLKNEGSIEKGEEIAGVKTVEGAPEGGLRFRVRMSPDATKEKPQRLIIWMHPSGSSMDATVEKLAPRFAQHGYALVVFTKKNYAGWSAADIARLPKSLDALAAIEGLSDERPILMGSSAGGQMALVEMPENAAARRVPLFVLIGAKDEGGQMWKQMESAFKSGGTPVSVNRVEGKGHEWLFGENELQALDLWLQELARKRELPGPKSWRPKLGE
jgi:hypothetical protein